MRADLGGSLDFSSLADAAVARGEVDLDLDLDLRFDDACSLLDFFDDDLGDGLRDELPLRDDLDELDELDDLDLDPDLLLELPELDLIVIKQIIIVYV
jgi:hypothetical protein